MLSTAPSLLSARGRSTLANEKCGGIFGDGRQCDKPASMTFNMPGAPIPGTKLHLCTEHGNEFKASVKIADLLGDSAKGAKLEEAMKGTLHDMQVQWDEDTDIVTVMLNGEELTSRVLLDVTIQEFVKELTDGMSALGYDISTRQGKETIN